MNSSVYLPMAGELKELVAKIFSYLFATLFFLFFFYSVLLIYLVKDIRTYSTTAPHCYNLFNIVCSIFKTVLF